MFTLIWLMFFNGKCSVNVGEYTILHGLFRIADSVIHIVEICIHIAIQLGFFVDTLHI